MKNWNLYNNKNYIIKLIITLIFLLILILIYELLNIIFILIFALFLNILFSPLLNKLNKWKIWDWIWIFIIYVILWFLSFILIFAITPIFIKQFSMLINIIYDWINNYIEIYNNQWIDWFNTPDFIKNVLVNLDINNILYSLKDNIWQISTFISNNLKNFLVSWVWLISWITNFITNFILLFIFTLFIALERKQIRQFFYDILPNKISKYIIKKENKIVEWLSNWIKGQLILAITIFWITFLWLLSLRIFWIKIEEIFVLSLIAWIMEFVPLIWPLIALLPAIAIWLWIWIKATIIIIILYIIIQQLENNILVPKIMWTTLSLSPFSVLIAMTIWASLFWILWIIVSIPLVLILKIFIKDYLKYKKKI